MAWCFFDPTSIGRKDSAQEGDQAYYTTTKEDTAHSCINRRTPTSSSIGVSHESVSMAIQGQLMMESVQALVKKSVFLAQSHLT